MRKYYIPNRIHPGKVTLVDLQLPPRCAGLLFVFETKKAAKEFMGSHLPKDTEIMTMTREPEPTDIGE